MRDIVITLIVLIGCGYTLKRPYIGVLLWSWLSYMNPHRLAFGFAYSAPFAQITALVLLGSMLFSKETRKPPINSITVVWFVFVLFMGITSVFAFFPEIALKYYERVIKIQFIVFLTMMLITDMRKLNQLLWVISLSIGYFSVKGGVFTILTAGHHRVWGPNDSFIADNNSLAVGILMAIPFMIYLYQISERKWVKYGLFSAAILSLFTIIGSQSRGAFLAIAAVGLLYWLKSDRKLITTLVVLALTVLLLMFAPESWYKRMNTIENYEEDDSALGRLNAWEYAYNAANDNLLGVGLNSWSKETFLLYAPNPLDVHAAHSIYFSVLADHGWIGLFMFVAIFFMSWKTLTAIIKNTERNPDLKEQYLLAKMLQISLIAYLVGGAFLSLSYFDLPWHVVSFVVILDRICAEQQPLKAKPIKSNRVMKNNTELHMQNTYRRVFFSKKSARA
ncbi:putative O-glycosylation ligase, exosortase A system-associated [Methylomonas rivi]|uniref:O-glycosylation ligase, exosortase A system-associated n=1 Tax=Methylomonas rivi TaxID=2952226 RepID=A0ABT1U2U0_9GAMM|nr:putative O-glycosylation ligase, exosortase A system-associated [Methylomonas sp. WSC-6]MBS3913927.1 putative O-glycosylation ligase, exosortase A system-associated [Bacteroidota bacterium]MCQ8127946.1 putative O-glycosylation ligase, exosortase A system-associated [Methylomonas sp. WSC-6]